MKRFFLIALFTVLTSSIFAQDRISLFIGNANKYASVDLAGFRSRLCSEYRIPRRDLDYYYRNCGNNWGHVGLMLEIARISGRSARDICDYYGRYKRHGWKRILLEIGIRPGSNHYNPFYDRIHHSGDLWFDDYCKYCERHDRKHYKKWENERRKYYKRYHKHRKDWDDDDDDDDDDDWDDD